MAFKGLVFSVPASTPTPLPLTATDMRMGSAFAVENVGTADLRIGGPDVNGTDKGFPFPVGRIIPAVIDDGEVPYFYGAAIGSVALLARGV